MAHSCRVIGNEVGIAGETINFNKYALKPVAMAKLSLFLLTTLLLRGVAAQSLLPNGGFEAGAPTTAGMFPENWENPSESSPYDLAHAHADWLTTANKEQMRYLAGSLTPKEGQGMLGLMLLSPVAENFREYVSVRLALPLEPGKRYQIGFFIANPHDARYCQLKAPGFGAYLSEGKPLQQGNRLLSVQPQWQLKTVPKHHGWQWNSFEFEAERAYQYLTLGNFWPDSLLKAEATGSGEFACAYLLVDGVTVQPVQPPKPPVKQVTLGKGDTVQYQLASLSQQPGFQGRKLNVQQSVVVSSVALELTVWDDREADDDIISLNLNGDWVLREHKVTKKQLKINLELKPDQENYLVLFAHNMGQIPPNTTAISFEDSGKKQRLYLKSDLRTCGTLRLVYQP